MPGVIMRSVMVTLMPVHRIIARWLGQFMLMEMRESLQEEHRQEPKRQRHHQWIEQPVRIATSGRRFHARHERVRHHVKERYAKHDARNKAQSKLQSSMREAQHNWHHAARKGRHHDARAEDDEGGFGTHGSAGNAGRSSPSHRGRALHDTAATAQHCGIQAAQSKICAPIRQQRNPVTPCGAHLSRIDCFVRPLGW
jgi:hypothetical protein